MKNLIKYFGILIVSLSVISCITDKKSESAKSTVTETVKQAPVKSILTAEEQENMTPDEIIGKLKKGNENFVSNNLTQRDHSSQRREAMIGQYPKAIVLSCVDSRVPVEDVFDLGIGDIFVARVAGNIENADIVGSMEFATAVAGSKVVIVMGHTACGAVKHAVDNTNAASMEMNSLQNLLDEIKPSVKATPKSGEISSKNTEFLTNVIHKNAKITVEDIRKRSPKMASLEDDGKIKIVAAVYNMATGKVEFI
ncbi:carbonic anhydrase family protein [Polaribacter porphyrae]|uniref:Carbonic anhydrase n=1 Tax=Polaribacter porphyrae TaxID=1137780 RepID=A0A2S7WRZ6_9FLAO|nr:carbonic anhydrase family protein [Polaribacter porphyrae]PQJ80236.1 carbonic anhydrase [Polaribacter porphyrae]